MAADAVADVEVLDAGEGGDGLEASDAVLDARGAVEEAEDVVVGAVDVDEAGGDDRAHDAPVRGGAGTWCAYNKIPLG